MDNLLISVVIANYNRPVLVQRAILSALQQKCALLDIEVIICDDASTDCLSKEVLESFGNDVKYFRQAYNQGPQAARNLGLQHSRGTYTVILDDDDEFLPGSLAKCIELIQQLDGHEKFPVFQFAHTNGNIPNYFEIVTIDHYMSGKLVGDFTPVINNALFRKYQLKYSEEILGVGCEHLLWWHIALNWGIPSWKFIVQQLNTDATHRMTSANTYLKKAMKYARMEDLSIDFIVNNELSVIYKSYYHLKLKGAATYYLLGGDRMKAKDRLRTINSFSLTKLGLQLLCYMPTTIIMMLFKMYRK